MEEQHLEKLKNKLKEVSVLSTDCCIFRVPKRLREGNEKAYTPQVVSIGPLHHGEKGLESIEEHKILYVKDFLERTKVSIDDCFITLKQWEEKIRGYYAVTIDYNENELVEIIMVDGIFTLEVLLRGSFETLQKKNDRIFGKPLMHRDIIYDMLLLENQIPFFVLEYLLSLAYSTSFFPMEHDTAHVTGLPLIKLTHSFFKDRVYIRPLDEIICKLDQYSESRRILHFVDFVLKCHRPPPFDPPPKSKLQTLTIPSATELHQAGVKFEMVKDKNFFDIQFDNGILKIPQLKIRGSSEVFFRNLIAYEQCEFYDHYINDYIFIMDRLVDSAKDVELLLRKKILESKLSDKEKVATFISSLNSGPVVFSKKFYFTDLCEKLNAYYEVPWHNWKASLKHDYFSSPWAVLSIIAAAVLLVLTFVQTVCSVMY
ncbi:hypothetical protein RchiOBHm_Chr6g0298331 [Rosa chinensis]|uniref:Uncharacterized protein n=1 Tax=Rosa chinensis TaxID=74649 RepID=A0A2P6PXX2_ROSCH|nr:putative UPF0481 protein At3g02645 [Rosa chinensis]XP_024166256.1 putative UPF0481 protein At3g02645 [Rosa chinensis]PRQ26780.1 hypothetical protein RchiOBHm_Chr6g0298331 [Rosa chinensis]